MRNPIIPLFVIGIIVVTIIVAALHALVSGSASAKDKPLPAAVRPSPTIVVHALMIATATAAGPVDTPTDVPTLEPTATFQPIPPKVQVQINWIEGGASDLRGLQPLEKLPVVFLTRNQFREQYKKEMQATLPLEEVQLYLQQLWMLRLVSDPSIDFYEASADLGSDDILGQYDPISKRMIVITDTPQQLLDPQAQVTMAHEFVHSLQDENYKLAKLWPVGAPDQDRELAVRSLVEGDATLAGYTWAAEYMNGQDFRSLFDQKTVSADVANKTPLYLGMNTIFPYTMGPEFVSKIMQVGGFSTVNLSLQDPPSSTEQIMHPQKFLQVPMDEPQTVTLPDLSGPLGQGWVLKATNTLGEFDLNFMLKQNGASDPDRGADGWGGGMFSMYKLANEIMVYSRVEWDTDNDATEFEGAMNETFAKMPMSGKFRTDSGRYFYMVRSGKTVTFIACTNEPALERVVAAQ
jgi:hypothetical protein